MKVILVSDTRTGSTFVYQTLIDIFGLDNVIKVHLDGVFNQFEIIEGQLNIKHISQFYSISKNIKLSEFKNAKIVLTTRDKYEQTLSGIRTRFDIKKTDDITVDIVKSFFKFIVRDKILTDRGFDKNSGFHKHYVYFLQWFDRLVNNDIKNLLILPYHLFNNKFNYLFKMYEKFFDIEINKELRKSIIKKRSRLSNLNISESMDSFKKVDKDTHIHGIHVSSEEMKNISTSDIYLKIKELINNNIKSDNILDKFLIYQRFNGVDTNKKLLIFGDSHARVFQYMKTKINDINITPFVIGSSSARGTINEKSVSGFFKKFNDFVNESNDLNTYDYISIMVGEIDCCSLIWDQSKKKKTSIEEQLKISTDNLFEFIEKHVCRHFPPEKIIICGSILPVIKDDIVWGNVHNIRKGVGGNQKEKTDLTIKFNNILKDFSENKNMNYIDITDNTISSNGVIDDKYLDNNKFEHHLPSDKIWEFWYNKINLILNG